MVATNRRKWKVRFLDGPYPGLVEYFRTDTVIAPWSQVKAIERCEKKLGRVRVGARQGRLFRSSRLFHYREPIVANVRFLMPIPGVRGKPHPHEGGRHLPRRGGLGAP